MQLNIFFVALIYGFAGGFGITAGSHRLFAHKAYKANRALKIMLLYFQTIAFQVGLSFISQLYVNLNNVLEFRL